MSTDPVLLEQLHARATKPKRVTRYEISVDGGNDNTPAWLPVAVVDASSAKAAIRDWYEEHDDDHPPPVLVRAVPVGNITQVTVEYRQTRQLTIS